MLDKVRRRAEEFDIIHFHTDSLQFPLFQDLFLKCITKLHGRLDLADCQPIYRAFPDMPLVSISANQRRPMPPVNWASTIHPRDYRFSGDRGAYLASWVVYLPKSVRTGPLRLRNKVESR
jgi:hypothetical protein